MWAALDFYSTVGRHAAEVRQCFPFFLVHFQSSTSWQPGSGQLDAASPWNTGLCSLVFLWTSPGMNRQQVISFSAAALYWQEACFLFRQEGHQYWWWPPAPSSAASWQGDKFWKIKDAPVQSRLDNQKIPPMQHIWTIIYQNIFELFYIMSVIKCNNFP